MTRWGLILDPAADADAREEAWTALSERIRPAILFQLRRRIHGWRETEDLADLVVVRLRERFERQGPTEHASRLRACAEREVQLLCEERGAKGGIDPEFERDWSRSLLGAALDELGRVRPETRRILLRIYDRPEGSPPSPPRNSPRSSSGRRKRSSAPSRTLVPPSAAYSLPRSRKPQRVAARPTTRWRISCRRPRRCSVESSFAGSFPVHHRYTWGKMTASPSIR